MRRLEGITRRALDMTRIVAFAALTGVVALGACDSVGRAMSSHTDLVARAAGHELTADRAAEMLAPHFHIPAQADVVDAVANLWVDYVLLATAMSRDTTLAALNLDPLLRPFMDQEVVYKLRERVIQADTVISPEELRAQYERDEPSAQVRARHILLRVPGEASGAQRDSVLQRAQEVRAQAAAGEDFAQLARTHSQDPGSAQQGGDLDWFGRGQMVAPFEEAAFALQPGQISDVVESPFGFHIIKVEDRQVPDFEQVAEMYREQAIQDRIVEAEESYVRGLTEPMRIEVEDGAVDVARELARKPFTQLGGRAAGRRLVRYQGGGLSAQEYRGVIRSWGPEQRTRLAAANDDQVEQVLQGLTRNKILVEEATRQGLAMTPEEQDSLRREARQQLRAAADMTGLSNIQPEAGETLNQAIERRVGEFLQAILRGEQSVLPLGPLTYSLREQFGGEVYERAYPTVVSRVESRRPAGQDFGMPPGYPDMPPGADMPPGIPDMPPQVPPSAPQPDGR
jgi:hypothetical protein